MNNKNYTEADLFREWKAMSAKKFENKKLEKQKIMEAIQSKSQLTIVILKKGLRSKLKGSLVIIPFLIGFAMLNFDYDIPFFSNHHDVWVLIITSILTFAICLFLYFKAKKINDDFKNNASLLETLKVNLKIIKDAFFMERVFVYVTTFALFIYHVFVRISFARPLLETIIAIAFGGVLILLLIIFAESLNSKKFGKPIKELEENIIRLEILQ